MSKKLFVIYNPISGNNKSLKILPKVKSYLKDNDISFEIIMSEYKGHIKDILKNQNFSNYFSCCIIGGDGSFHEAINGYMSRNNQENVPLSLVPAGSGNSLARDLDIIDYKSALEKIIRMQTRSIDIAKISYNNHILYSFNIVGWGMVATVGKKAEKYRWLGSERYTILSLLEIIFKKTYDAKITIYDKNNHKISMNDKFMFIMVCNTIHTGKGMKIAPKAVLDDGLFDLVLIKDAPRIKLLNLMSKLFSGRHIYDNLVKYKKIKKIILDTNKAEDLNVDGELKGSSPFELEINKKAITIIN